jgi:hypothetical protein
LTLDALQQMQMTDVDEAMARAVDIGEDDVCFIASYFFYPSHLSL